MKGVQKNMSNSILFLVITLIFLSAVTGDTTLFAGVCDGRNGDNLPSPAQTISLYQKINVGWVRMYEPFPDLLAALEGTGILVAIGPKNEEIKTLAEQYEYAVNWVKTFIVPYDVAFNWITVGNEVLQGEIGRYVPQAIKNINTALTEIGISRKIHVTTVLSGTALANSYPPSAGVFKPGITEIVTQIASVLSSTDSPLMVNVYPYFAYASDPSHVSLEYATFRSTAPVVVDGEYQYTNIFDAILDAFNAALEKLGYGGVKVYVAETGWPTRGNPPYTSVENARAYNQGLLRKLTTGNNRGTPRRPEVPVVTFFFELFDEDLKEGEVEKSFGLFTPDMVPVYDMWNVNVSSLRA